MALDGNAQTSDRTTSFNVEDLLGKRSMVERIGTHLYITHSKKVEGEIWELAVIVRH
jgi:hypothetical protein